MEIEPLIQLLIANIPSWISCGECWYGILTYCYKSRNENKISRKLFVGVKWINVSDTGLFFLLFMKYNTIDVLMI